MCWWVLEKMVFKCSDAVIYCLCILKTPHHKMFWPKSVYLLLYEYYKKITLFNPNTFAGLVGKVRKKLSPEGGRKGGGRKKAHAARPPDPGLEPGTCRVLGEGPQLHARGAV